MREDSRTLDLFVQVATSVSTHRFVLIEHSRFPSFPEYLAIRCLNDGSKGTTLANTLPILVPASEWKDTASVSGSNVLRNSYSVPLDDDQMLKGQMERGDLFFIFEDTEQLGDKLSVILNEIERTTQIPNLQKCYFVGCCNSATNPLLSESPILFHVVVATDISPETCRRSGPGKFSYPNYFVAPQTNPKYEKSVAIRPVIEKQNHTVKNFGTVGYVLPRSEFLRGMADAVTTGDEDHGYRRNLGNLLGVMPRFAG